MRIALAVAAGGAVARYLVETQAGVYGGMRRFRMVLA